MKPERVDPLIYVTDDNMEVLKLVQRKLNNEHYYRVAIFTTYEDMEASFNLKPHLIILDNYLSKFQDEDTGLNNYKKIKQALPETKVIILSGETDPEIIRSFTQEGVYGYIVKDTQSMDKLVSTINSIFGGNISDE